MISRPEGVTGRGVSMLLLFLTAVIWGVAFVAQRVGMDYVGPFTFNGVRFILGAVSLLPVIAIFERSKKSVDVSERMKRTIWSGLLGGVVLFTAASLQQIGVQITGSAGKSGFITGLYIVVTPVLGIALGKKTGLPTWLGAAIACIGLYLLSAPAGLSSVGVGDIALLTGAVFWAVHILLIDRFAGVIFPLRFASIQFAVCGVLSLIAAFMVESVSLTAVLSGYVPILYGGLLSVGVAYTLQIIGQRHVEPAKAALIFSTESLFSAIGAAVLLREFMTTRAYVGCALIFTGIILSQLRFKKYADA